MKIAVQLGAGNIGRGFMGQLLWEAGFNITFVDTDKQLVSLLNERGKYPLRLLDAYSREQHAVVIDHFTAIAAEQRDKVATAIADATLVGTAVGVKNLEAVAGLLADGIGRRFEQNPTPLDIFLCENMFGAAALLQKNVSRLLAPPARRWAEKSVGFVGTSVARMVASGRQQSDDPLLIIADSYRKVPYDGKASKAGDPGIDGFYPVENFKAEVERKLFTHNLGHASLAYLGYLKGYTYIHEPFADEFVSSVFEKALDETSQALLKRYPEALDPHEHRRVRQDVRTRFGNPMVGDTIVRVAKDPIRKLSPEDRLIGSARLCLEQGVFPAEIGRVCGAALCYDFEGDAEARELQEMIRADGLEKTLERISDIKAGTPFGERIVQSYRDLKEKRIHWQNRR
jgi:mannitol-1-phosphate 5-dehydrogenase